MARLIYLYDGTFAGMLHAVARAIKDGREVHAIIPSQHYQASLFDTAIALTADAAQADSLLQYLHKLHPLAARLAVYSYLSEEPGVEMEVYSFVQLCLQRGSNALSYESHAAVCSLKGLSYQVSREAHKYKGLIRFRLLTSGLHYGPFEPRHNIVSLCAQHFRRRLAGCQWMLHDLRRNIALYWDSVELHTVAVDETFSAYVTAHGEVPPQHLAEDELHYQQLWRSFHGVISNQGRHNPQLQQQNMPQRYWKYLTEM